jgi:hypothetical protein
MPDPFSGTAFSDPQSQQLLREREKQERYGKIKQNKGKAKKDSSSNDRTNISELYERGIKLLAGFQFTVELDEAGDHLHHRILKPCAPPAVKGISYPGGFNPLQDISTRQDLEDLERAFVGADDEVRDFWLPFYRPKKAESDFSNYSERMLAMQRMQKKHDLHEVQHYGHTFDPLGDFTGNKQCRTPRVWVPDHQWFSPALRELKFEDVFTIFPHAECQLLKLIIGRIGVGRSNHLPPGFTEPVDHTARMAAVIVGKDAGLGKSTLFNGMTAAFTKCGFTTNTFKSTEDRFGLKSAALADIAYKDDTALKSLKLFLAAEETKILVTNGIFQAEEKFQNAEQIWPKCVLIVNSNGWDANFAYDLDPGIIDRIKVLSTYREYEVKRKKDFLQGTVSEGSPDLRPRAHIGFLANKLGVSEDAIYLWCLRLATDRFWEIITDNSDPTVNRLQHEVRYWTSRQRIKFMADTTQALINAMALSSALRSPEEEYFMPELTPTVLQKHLADLQFVGLDKSCSTLIPHMKMEWEREGRPSTHYYQGFRDIRWESIGVSMREFEKLSTEPHIPHAEAVKSMMGQIVLRSGFKTSSGMTHVVEAWDTARYALGDINESADNLRKLLSETQLSRVQDENITPTTDWIEDPKYSPDTAEKLRPTMV